MQLGFYDAGKLFRVSLEMNFLLECRCAWQFLKLARFTLHKPPPAKMKKLCPNCNLVNFKKAKQCLRCGLNLIAVASARSENNAFLKSKIFRRVLVCISVCLFVIFGFYVSLIGSSKQLSYQEKQTVKTSIEILEARGFSSEAFLLKYVTAFRGTDNWLNASVEKENAYAATNFPFEIITIYPDFFAYPVDDVERAAILLHEARHLKGADEKEAYRFVWQNRKRLGWTDEIYADSVILQNVRKQTKEFAPELFVCDVNPYGDCTRNN